MSNDMTEVIKLLKRIARNTDRIASAMECRKKSSTAKPSDDTRVALAVIAIARGASSFQEIADELTIGLTRAAIDFRVNHRPIRPRVEAIVTLRFLRLGTIFRKTE